MTKNIKIAIVGYGNLGRGIELALSQNPDLELFAIFSRRDPANLAPVFPDSTVLPIADFPQYAAEIDVAILAGGSHRDLPAQGPQFASLVNTVDSFDTHADIPEYFAALDEPARAAGKTALLSVGWDPGLFSLNRLFGEAVLPEGQTYTFWGKGVSQGHSDAIRKVPGVAAGVQYTVPSAEAIEQVRGGSQPQLSTREKHKRICYVVLVDGADGDQVRREIVQMPKYFADYDTSVEFISAQELAEQHSGMPHGGFVLRSGSSAAGEHQVIEYGLKLDSNPEFTASVLVAYARATHRLNESGHSGAITVLDVPPALLSPKSPEQLRAELL